MTDIDVAEWLRIGKLKRWIPENYNVPEDKSQTVMDTVNPTGPRNSGTEATIPEAKEMTLTDAVGTQHVTRRF